MYGGSSRYSEVKGTKILRVDPSSPDADLIRVAADVIRRGGTVAFPTETVYGLGSDALNPEAVMKIFKAKNRPLDNPIIVHICRFRDVNLLASNIPRRLDILAERFWPGPLTVILKASDIVPRVTTGGLDTVAVRMPRHRVALALIRESGTPIAAPSANLAGRPSPTSDRHVIEDLAGRIDVILAAGSTPVGVESTVIDMTGKTPTVLRPGGVPVEDLRAVLGRVNIHPSILSRGLMEPEKPLSPGMKYRHYAPRAEMVLVEGEDGSVIKKIRELIDEYVVQGKRVGVLTFDENLDAYSRAIIKSLGSRRQPETAARRIFNLLREFDREDVDVIIAEGMPEKGLGLAVMNRLRKACGYNIIKV